jgi:hypothetical protein
MYHSNFENMYFRYKDSTVGYTTFFEDKSISFIKKQVGKPSYETPFFFRLLYKKRMYK